MYSVNFIEIETLFVKRKKNQIIILDVSIKILDFALNALND